MSRAVVRKVFVTGLVAPAAAAAEAVDRELFEGSVADGLDVEPISRPGGHGRWSEPTQIGLELSNRRWKICEELLGCSRV